jgi:hypothetical protein
MCEEGERESGGRFGLDPTYSGLLGQAWLARLLGQPNRSFDLFYFLKFLKTFKENKKKSINRSKYQKMTSMIFSN